MATIEAKFTHSTNLFVNSRRSAPLQTQESRCHSSSWSRTWCIWRDGYYSWVDSSLLRKRLWLLRRGRGLLSRRLLDDDETWVKMLLFYLFYFFLFYINPNFCLGRPFGFSTYRVRTFDLLLGSLKAHAQCLSLPQCRALRYPLLSFVTTLLQGEMKETVQILENEFSRTRNI